MPSVVTPTKSAYRTSVAPGPMPPPPPGIPEGAPEGAAVEEPEAPSEQPLTPVMVAIAAAPPSSSDLFMNQRRVRSAPGVRGLWW